MTEKRFEVKNDYYKGLILVDNLTDEIIEEDIGTGSCYNSCNKLNELAEENEQLKQQISEATFMDFQIMYRDIEILKKEKEQLQKQLDTEHQMLENAILLERTRMGKNSLKQYKEAIQ